MFITEAFAQTPGGAGGGPGTARGAWPVALLRPILVDKINSSVSRDTGLGDL